MTKQREWKIMLSGVICHESFGLRQYLIVQYEDDHPCKEKWDLFGGPLFVDLEEYSEFERVDSPLEFAFCEYARKVLGVELERVHIEHSQAIRTPQGTATLRFHFSAYTSSSTIVLKKDTYKDFCWIQPGEVSEYELLGGGDRIIKRFEKLCTEYRR